MSESRVESYPAILGNKETPWWKNFLKVIAGGALAIIGLKIFLNSTADLFSPPPLI